MSLFGFKDLESVSIKATYKIEVGSRIFNPGEVILYLDKVQIAGLESFVDTAAARGGFNNAPRVFWETLNEQEFSLRRGVFSKEQLAILTNSNLLEPQTSDFLISQREQIETNEEGVATCKFLPAQNLFVYDKTGAKVEFTQNEREITTGTPYQDLIVDYEFEYTGGAQRLQLSTPLTSGFLSLEARTRLKDDETGKVVTGIFKIPKLKLATNVVLRLGTGADPTTVEMRGTAVPVGERGNTYASELCFLSEDIESDL